jgi:hypothetical protein
MVAVLVRRGIETILADLSGLAAGSASSTGSGGAV